MAKAAHYTQLFCAFMLADLSLELIWHVLALLDIGDAVTCRLVSTVLRSIPRQSELANVSLHVHA
ncbi:hypothetical protein OBBRIDRAFT_794240 [Obba rivulosa]|uniref:F-box domain-containing protein n=1 Tax=Obba rivulosa TaxID=1052685 RepID=A0A8E2B1G0_9APHY|nr:hypothetical protein OBBRIDRAFT_794240 [Obba rivulosa]